ncbi:Pvc16 family protein [Streptacidiphilus rugosus]|uniref:Pvc16 family protein n=1 Tax=Streptacidiphilus rugosus TaxID=405783 RepID=UPI0018DB25E6|nr:Pvc16 family protein [Streptacidiphilus rugosus]
MLHEVDQALRAFLAPHLPQDATLTFQSPADGDPRPPGGAGQAPVVHLFMYQVCEDPTRRNASWTDVRDGSRTVIGRRDSSRRYQLSYLVTCRAATAAVEHETLGQILAAFAGADVLPATCLSGSLAECRLPVELVAGSPAGTESARGAWASLGAAQGAFLDLTVSAPLVPATLDVASPAAGLHFDFNTDATPPPAPGPAETATERRFTTVRVRENRSPLPPRPVKGAGIEEPHDGGTAR